MGQKRSLYMMKRTPLSVLNIDPNYFSGPVLLGGSVVEFCSRVLLLVPARVVKEEKQIFQSFIIDTGMVWNHRFPPLENRTFYTLAVCSLWGRSMKEIIPSAHHSMVAD